MPDLERCNRRLEQIGLEPVVASHQVRRLNRRFDLLVHALGAAPEVIFRIDIAPLGRALISRSQQMWRLTSLEPLKDGP